MRVAILLLNNFDGTNELIQEVEALAVYSNNDENDYEEAWSQSRSDSYTLFCLKKVSHT